MDTIRVQIENVLNVTEIVKPVSVLEKISARLVLKTIIFINTNATNHVQKVLMKLNLQRKSVNHVMKDVLFVKIILGRNVQNVTKDIIFTKDNVSHAQTVTNKLVCIVMMMIMNVNLVHQNVNHAK